MRDACAKLTKGEGLGKTCAVRFCFADTRDYLRNGTGSPPGVIVNALKKR